MGAPEGEAATAQEIVTGWPIRGYRRVGEEHSDE